ncbi:MAG: ATP-binding protein [Zetaproteobacteria bacterium]|nr:ATP-binding protein [Zetaproteobacteria bacterium]
MTVIRFYKDYQSELTLLNATIHQIEKSTLSSFKEALWDLNMKQIESLGAGIFQVPEVVHIQVKSENDEVIFEKKSSNLQLHQHLTTKSYFLDHVEEEETIHTGRLSIAYSHDVMYAKIKRDAIYFFLSQGLKTLIVSSVLFLLFHLIVTKHLLLITEYIDQFRKTGRYQKRSKSSYRSTDEIDRLEESISKMVAHIETYNEKSEAKIKRQSEELNRSLQFKSEFLASMSHEIRTPLNAVVGYMELLQETDLSAQQSEYVRKGLDSSTILLDLINQVLDLSKIEQGKVTLKPTPTNIIWTLQKSLQMFESLAHKQNTRLILDTSSLPKELYLDIDEKKVFQVIINIVGNAIKFTTNGSVTVVVALGTQNKLLMDISDTGVGIPADELSKIFGAYDQVEHPQNPSVQGTGLGLTITKQIVSLMGGNISVSSTIGEGSTFSICMPVKVLPTQLFTQSTHVNTPASRNQLTPSQALSKRTSILVVEDNQTNQQLLKELLKECDTSVCDHGEQAVQAVKARAYDIILMDNQMPVMDGAEATRKIRTIEAELGRKSCVIISVSANAFAEEVQVMLEAGCNDYLSKPIRKKELLAKIIDWSSNAVHKTD